MSCPASIVVRGESMAMTTTTTIEKTSQRRPTKPANFQGNSEIRRVCLPQSGKADVGHDLPLAQY